MSGIRISYNAILNWLSAFERFFLAFSITPWAKKIAKAIQKERKVYLFDIPRVEDSGARFENMIALELWRAVTNGRTRSLSMPHLVFRLR